MSSTSSPSHDAVRFPSDAARSIFRRAAEHQEMARAAAPANANGLTLAELQAIGAEAGIAPEYVAAATAEYSADDPDDDTPWWYAGPATVAAKTVVPGTITDGPVWAAMVRELRDTFGTGGVATQIGDSLEWSFSPPMGGASTRVTVTPEPHGTRIRITRSKLSSARMGAVIGGTFSISGLAVGGLIFTFKGFDVVGLAFMVVLMAVGAAFMGLSIPVYRSAVRREQEQFDALMDRLELIALKERPAMQRSTPTPSQENRNADRLGDALSNGEPLHEETPAARHTQNREQV